MPRDYALFSSSAQPSHATRRREPDLLHIECHWPGAPERGSFANCHTVSEKIKMRDGDTMLIMVKGAAVIHFTPNMSLPHVEFVRRATGELPEGAWVGTVSRLDGKVVAISSKHFFGYQLPGPDWVQAAVRDRFE